jgi:hypothetical protein
MILECYYLLKQIESAPAMWTGEKTVKSISNYLSGYYHALLDHKIVLSEKTDEPFSEWVAKKLGYCESTAGWTKMILAHSIGLKPENISWEKFSETAVNHEQHLESIKLFYELVEHFRNENNYMTKQLFFIANMPASRPADYYLGYKGGSVFLDFNNRDDDRIYLSRISFDGYGCCMLSEEATPLSLDDSQIFKTLYKGNLKDHSLLLTIVKKSIRLNIKNIWLDALEEYNLVDK